MNCVSRAVYGTFVLEKRALRLRSQFWTSGPNLGYPIRTTAGIYAIAILFINSDFPEASWQLGPTDDSQLWFPVRPRFTFTLATVIASVPDGKRFISILLLSCPSRV